jgi:putative peptidoglycan lipid II flippase
LLTLGRGVAFFIPIVIAWTFKVNLETDAFFLAYGIVFLIASIFSAAAESVLVPFVTETLDDLVDTRRFLNGVLLATTLVLVPLTGIFVGSARALLPFVTSLSPETAHQIFMILLELSPLVLLVSWASIFNGALNAHGKFWLPALSPSIRGIIVIASAITLKDSLGIHSLALGYIIAELLRVIFSALMAQRQGLFGLRASFTISAHTRDFFKISFFQLVGNASIGINPVVDRLFATYAGTGAITLLEYGRNLFLAGVGVLTSGFFIVILTDWSHQYSQESNENFGKRVGNVVKVVILLSVVASAFLGLLRFPLVSAVYGNGLTHDETQMVIQLFGLFILGILPFVLSSLYAKAHVAMKNSKVLMQTALISNVLNLLLNYVLFKLIGLQGLVLSTGITYTLTLYWVYRKFQLATSPRRPDVNK